MRSKAWRASRSHEFVLRVSQGYVYLQLDTRISLKKAIAVLSGLAAVTATATKLIGWPLG